MHPVSRWQRDTCRGGKTVILTPIHSVAQDLLPARTQRRQAAGARQEGGQCSAAPCRVHLSVFFFLFFFTCLFDCLFCMACSAAPCRVHQSPFFSLFVCLFVCFAWLSCLSFLCVCARLDLVWTLQGLQLIGEQLQAWLNDILLLCTHDLQVNTSACFLPR